MQSDQKWLSEDMWQRAVDNDLTSAELVELVAVCDRHPELWKRCAVAFLEEQALRQELKQLASRWQPSQVVRGTSSSTQASWRSEPSTSIALRAGLPLHQAPIRTIEMGRSSQTAHMAQSGKWLHASALNSLALAASLMLAFLVGWQASRRVNADRSSAAVRNSRVADSDLKGSGGEARFIPKDRSSPRESGMSDMQLVDTSPSLTMAADAIEQALQSPDQFVALDSRMPQQLADLQQRGLVRIESTEGFLPVKLKNGNTAVVPVQQFDVRTIGHAY